MSGVERIKAERARQLTSWTDDHDDRHFAAELVVAAMAYANASLLPGVDDQDAPEYWPWSHSSWKPSADPIRNLVKAGALIAAEIDRLERLKRLTPGGANRVRLPLPKEVWTRAADGQKVTILKYDDGGNWDGFWLIELPDGSRPWTHWSLFAAGDYLPPPPRSPVPFEGGGGR